MEQEQLLKLTHVTVRGNDGRVFRHRVTGIHQTGQAAAVTVDPKGEPLPGLPFPKRPRVTWKNSRTHSRTRAFGQQATVHRTSQNGADGWTYFINGAKLKERPFFTPRQRAQAALSTGKSLE